MKKKPNIVLCLTDPLRAFTPGSYHTCAGSMVPPCTVTRLRPARLDS